MEHFKICLLSFIGSWHMPRNAEKATPFETEVFPHTSLTLGVRNEDSDVLMTSDPKSEYLSSLALLFHQAVSLAVNPPSHLITEIFLLYYPVRGQI